MECSNCGSSSAKLHTLSSQGIEKKVCLCDACFEKLYAVSDAPEMFAHLFGGRRTAKKKSASCASCGLTLDAFLKSGLLGCAGCYSAFRDEVINSIKYCQRSSLHCGKKPNGISELKYDLVREQEECNAQLDAAVLSGDRVRAQELFRRLKGIQEQISRAEEAQEKIRFEAYATAEEDD